MEKSQYIFAQIKARRDVLSLRCSERRRSVEGMEHSTSTPLSTAL